MRIRSLTKRERVIFIICILTGLFYFVYNILFKGVLSRINILDNKIEIKRVKFNKNQEIINQAKKIDNRYDYYLNRLGQRGSNERVLTSVISQIEEVSKKLDLPISDLKPQKVKEWEFSKVFSVSLTIEGKLSNILHFIYILQNEPYFFEVDQIGLNESRDFDKKSNIRTQLVLSKMFISDK